MIDAGFTLGSSLWFLLTLNIGAWCGVQVFGVLADRVGSRSMLYTAYVLSFASIIALAFTKNFYAITLLVALAGAGVMGGQALINAYGLLFYPPAVRSTGAGFAFGVGRVGAMLGPVLTGVIISMNLSLSVNFMTLAIPGLLACIAVYFIQEKYGAYVHLKEELDIGK
jgi:AAHS family benzoate transporter-like MFS transporter